MADGIPGLGHAKGVMHYARGDKEGGDQAMKSASRTTGVMACGAGGFLLGGPAGAMAGGIYGGALMDATTTAVDSAMHDESRPAGYFAAVENTIKNPNSGDIFDSAFMPVADGLAGYSAGKLVDRMQRVNAASKNQNVPNKVDLKGKSLCMTCETQC